MVMIVRLFLKRDMSAIDARFEVCDDTGGSKYTIRGKHTPSGESIRIMDLSGASVCKIRRLGFSALSAYTISAGGESVRMNIAVSGSAATVRFHGISFMIRGDVLSGSYDILDADNSVVCVVNKDFAKCTLTLTVNMEERELFCIASAVCIDSLSNCTQPALQLT